MIQPQRRGADPLGDLKLPNDWTAHFRKLLARIEAADTAFNCMLAQERAEGVVEGFEISQARDAQTIERLYLIVENAGTERLARLEAGAGPG